MPEERWVNFFRTVEGKTASVFMHIGLPRDLGRPLLLTIRVWFLVLNPEELTTSEEAPVLFEMEGKLANAAESESGGCVYRPDDARRSAAVLLLLHGQARKCIRSRHGKLPIVQVRFGMGR